MNIRTTVSYQELTGCWIDYAVPGRCFPELGDDLLAAKRSIRSTYSTPVDVG